MEVMVQFVEIYLQLIWTLLNFFLIVFFLRHITNKYRICCHFNQKLMAIFSLKKNYTHLETILTATFLSFVFSYRLKNTSY